MDLFVLRFSLVLASVLTNAGQFIKVDDRANIDKVLFRRTFSRHVSAEGHVNLI